MIDISKWKEFKLSEIVPDIHNAKAYNNSELVEIQMNIYYILLERIVKTVYQDLLLRIIIKD